VRFEPLERSHFPLLEAWLATPHVARWWAPLDLEGIEADFGASVDGTDPTRCFLIVEGDRPIGFIQAYRVADSPEYAQATEEPDAVGVDLFIGEPSRVDRGVGTIVLEFFLDDVVWPSYPDVRRCIASPSVHNLRSQRAFEKAGFVRGKVATVPGEKDDELVMLAVRADAPGGS
jgi:aminoglycoside 6'-N-acetyltransferase